MQASGWGVIRQRHFIAVVVTFLMGCAVLLVVGASGVQAEASQQNKQKHTDATNTQQGRSPEATASEEARCEGTRKVNVNLPARFTTNDLPGCPMGGLLLGTEKGDLLAGEDGDDEIRALGGSDSSFGGSGNDVIYGGAGTDSWLSGDGTAGDGNDIIYGGPGDDTKLDGGPSEAVYGGPGELLPGGGDGQRDKIYCGEGRDSYWADKEDYVSSSCEVKLPNSLRFPRELTAPIAVGGGPGCRECASGSPVPVPQSGGPAILLLAAVLLLGSGSLTYAILRRR
jgi:Ca2+-binding RTX toxin-like protein